MFIPGYVYKNKRTGTQFIPMSCSYTDEKGLYSRGYYVKDKKDEDIILVDGELQVKTKDISDWEKTYEHFKHD